MPRHNKQIRSSGQANSGQSLAPHSLSASTNHERPVFSLEHLGGDYCLSKCNREQEAAFADTLHKLSKLTWSEIQRAPKQGNGTEIISREALGTRPYPPELTDEINLLAFRYHGKHPMVGYRTGRMFTILFLDRDFTLYDHG